MAQDRRMPYEVLVQIREQWVLLTEDDVHKGLEHRENFLERLRHRHGLGMEEARAELEAFERRQPALMFEKV